MEPLGLNSRVEFGDAAEVESSTTYLQQTITLA